MNQLNERCIVTGLLFSNRTAVTVNILLQNVKLLDQFWQYNIFFDRFPIFFLELKWGCRKQQVCAFPFVPHFVPHLYIIYTVWVKTIKILKKSKNILALGGTRVEY